MFLYFLTFSIDFLKTELFISLNNSFPKLIIAIALLYHMKANVWLLLNVLTEFDYFVFFWSTNLWFNIFICMTHLVIFSIRCLVYLTSTSRNECSITAFIIFLRSLHQNWTYLSFIQNHLQAFLWHCPSIKIAHVSWHEFQLESLMHLLR